MSHWDYRVMQFAREGDPSCAIHEVHYDDDGKPVAYTENPAYVAWDADEGDPTGILLRMAVAIDKPTLTPADFGESA